MPDLIGWILEHEGPFKSKSRLTSLYSDFRPLRHLNPDGYAANVTAWRDALFHAAAAGVLHSSSAAQTSRSNHERAVAGKAEGQVTRFAITIGPALERDLELQEWGRPLGLSAVVRECAFQREMMSLDQFLSAKTSLYARSWTSALPSPWTGAQWVLAQLGLGRDGATTDSMLRQETLVLLANVETAARKVLDHVDSGPSTPSALTFTPSTFTATFSPILFSDTNDTKHANLSSTDLAILLTHLSRDLAALSFNETTIKFVTPSQRSQTAPLSPITETDTTIAQLQALADNLTRQITALEARSTAHHDAVKAALKAGHKPQARASLRAAKFTDATLASRLESREQATQTLTAIDNAASNAEMVRIMSDSVHVLRGLNEKVGGVEGAQKVSDAFYDQAAEVTEIGAVFAENGAATSVDEDELDAEVAALEAEAAEEKASAERKETLASLPAAPNNDSPLTFEPKAVVDERKAEEKRAETHLQSSIERLQRLHLNHEELEETSTIVGTNAGQESPKEREERIAILS